MHLFNNLYFCTTIASTIIGDGTFLTRFGLNNMDANTANLSGSVWMSGFCLAGIPIIIMGLWGVFQRIEALVRFYFWYMLLCIVLDLGAIVQTLVLHGPCESIPSLAEGAGQAYACGIARIADAAMVLVLFGVQFYLIHIVWSFCEDLQDNGAIDIGDLGKDWRGQPLSKAELWRKTHHSHQAFHDSNAQDAMYGAIATSNEWKIYDTGIFGGSEQQMYENVACSGLGCEKIFKISKDHEMRYPPPHVV